MKYKSWRTLPARASRNIYDRFFITHCLYVNSIISFFWYNSLSDLNFERMQCKLREYGWRLVKANELNMYLVQK